MNIAKKQVISGIKWAVFVTASLIFLPPLLVGFLPVWVDAKTLVSQDSRVTALCKAPATMELSRWLYSYKFSGESADASFNGVVAGADCNKKFQVRLKKKAEIWVITDIVPK